MRLKIVSDQSQKIGGVSWREMTRQDHASCGRDQQGDWLSGCTDGRLARREFTSTAVLRCERRVGYRCHADVEADALGANDPWPSYDQDRERTSLRLVNEKKADIALTDWIMARSAFV